MEDYMIRRMRAINGVLKYIRNENKESAISRYLIENIILRKKVYYIKSGNTYYVDLDEVLKELGIANKK